jgi:hypothetical protein
MECDADYFALRSISGVSSDRSVTDAQSIHFRLMWSHVNIMCVRNTAFPSATRDKCLIRGITEAT